MSSDKHQNKPNPVINSETESHSMNRNEKLNESDSGTKTETIEINFDTEEDNEPTVRPTDSIDSKRVDSEPNDLKTEESDEKTDSFSMAIGTTSQTQKKPKKQKRKKISEKKLNSRIKVYEPKRNFEPMLSIDRLLKSHLMSRVKDSTSTAKPEPNPKEPPKEEADNMITEGITPEVTGNKAVDVIVNHVTAGIPEWMSKPKDKVYKKYKVKSGLECIEKLRKFYIYDNIRIIDKLFNNNKFTTNCMTIRNADYQQLFYVGPEKNRHNDIYRPFTLRFIDQYCRHVISVKKLCKCICFSRFAADIECPPGELIGHLRQQRYWFTKTLEFVILEPKTLKRRFTIRRLSDAALKHEFDILNDANESIGTILKRFEKININNVLEEDHCVRIGVPQVTAPEDKVTIISSALIINIFYLRQFKIAYNK